MSPTGHNVTAAALGLGIAAWFSNQIDVLAGGLAFAAAMMGARAPDWSELYKWVDGKRYSLIPHRGPTHWPGWWMAGVWYSIDSLSGYYQVVGVAFFASSLLHLVFDIMTPTGIPLWHPFAKKRSLNIYRSRAILHETGLAVMSWVLSIGWIVSSQVT